MRHSFSVEDLKIRLDKYLAAHLREISRSQIQRVIAAGKVWVNNQVIKESKFIVRKGDIINCEIQNAKFKIQPADLPLNVLYDNHGLLIIDKPAGLAVHPGAGFRGNSLASALLYHFKDIKDVGEEHRPGIVHRLDKDTSGVMLIAKTKAMYEYLKDAFAQRKIKKEYIALVQGRLEKTHGFLDAPIGKSKTDFRKYDTKNIIEPKEALTEYRVLEYLKDPATLDEFTLVEVKLHTGRTHQIRVHFKSLGHPLAGDTLYGSRTVKPQGLYRQFLHAKKIEVRLPLLPDGNQGGPDGTWIEAESQLPDDLKKVLKKLDSNLVNQL